MPVQLALATRALRGVRDFAQLFCIGGLEGLIGDLLIQGLEENRLSSVSLG